MNRHSLLVSVGRPRSPGAPLNVPLIPASAFAQGLPREYARDHATPTWEALEELVGELEGGAAVSFASGMAAAAAVFDQIPSGSDVVIPDDCYHGIVELASRGERTGR